MDQTLFKILTHNIMAKNKEHDSVTFVKNGVSMTKVVPTVVRDGKLVADDTAPEIGVKN